MSSPSLPTGLTIVDVDGDDYEVGAMIAEATMTARDDLADLIGETLGRHPLSDAYVRDTIDGLRAVLSTHSPGSLEQITAMAAGYGIPENEILVWLLGTYFGSATADDEGCSVFAWQDGLADGSAQVAKNRDSDLRLQHLQTVVRVRPRLGNSWAALSTAGAPDVHSAGVNEAGLAIADTHVPSRDVGIGLPRFTLMRHVLEKCLSVRDALAYVQSVPRMGFGNLVLADEHDRAVVECGHTQIAVLRDAGRYVAATNHFVTPILSTTCWFGPETPRGRDSRARRESLERQLSESGARGVAQADILASHSGPGPLCVHAGPRGYGTIARVVLNPQARSLTTTIGTPCAGESQTVTVLGTSRS